MPRHPLSWIDDELDALDARHLRRHLVDRNGPQGATIDVGKKLVNFGANDYLGLAADPRLAAAANETARHEGWGSGASPLVAGRSAQHARLEQKLAEFEAAPAALTFTSGFAANLGTVAALVSRGDAIYADAANHASLIDGCRLSRAEVHIYRHADVDHLRQLLADSSRHRRKLIATDSLFSMDGDLAPLAEIVELAETHGAMLMVDEAHATGVFGRSGRGVCEHLGVEDAVHIRMGTLSKALAGAGGFVVGSRQLIAWLANRARSYVFSTAYPPAVAAASIAALDIVRAEPQRRTQLLDRAANLRQLLTSQGWDVGNSASQIIPIHLGDPQQTMQLAAALRERGQFVPGIRPPTVPEGKSRLRLSLSWSHSTSQIDDLASALGGLTALRVY